MRKSEMGRKIQIFGKDYSRKKLTQFALRQGSALAVAQKELIGFDSGVIAVQMQDGMVRVCNSADEECANMWVIFYEGNSISEQEIIFSDEYISRNWKNLYIYFFDDEGGYLLFANREMMTFVGVYLESVGKNGLAFLAQKAVNLSALLDEKLANKIANEILNSTDNFSLLEVIPCEK